MRTIVTARNYGTWLFERFDLAELRAGAAVLVGFDDEDTFSYEMSDAELVRGMTEKSHEYEVETIIAPHGLVGDRIES